MAHGYVLQALVLAAVVAVAGCGVKGPLESPPTAASASAGEIIEGDTTEKTPDRRIILDGLLD